ncbi:MAG: Lrp/AsnC family transcriptional regulator [Oscillospiraceae bacterium]|nr:Lrp/AsnC family transcriptional regulator [Oscillospiraceae bacterium]
MDKLLKLLCEDARLPVETLATMTGSTPEEVAAKIQKMESDGIILGYRAVVDWDKADREMVESYIDLKIAPKKDFGFDEFAELVSQMPEVKSCTLMSGGSDISLVVEGRSFKDIALFVGKRLATMESVISTSTRFVLKTYKKQGHQVSGKNTDDREMDF